MREDPVRRHLLERLPDEPLNVDLRGILLASDVEILPRETGAAGYAVHVASIDLACLLGAPDAAALRSLAARAGRGTQVVFDEDLREAVEAAVPSLHAEPIHFYAFPDGTSPALPAATNIHVRVLEPGSPLDTQALPAHLASEMEAALRRTLLAVAFVDEAPVSFCYPHHETEGYWDVSVDTLESHRRRGLASLVFGAAYEAMKARGKQPVWGSLDSNAASNGVALRLGMELIGSRYVLIAAGSSGRC